MALDCCTLVPILAPMWPPSPGQPQGSFPTSPRVVWHLPTLFPSSLLSLLPPSFLSYLPFLLHVLLPFFCPFNFTPHSLPWFPFSFPFCPTLLPFLESCSPSLFSIFYSKCLRFSSFLLLPGPTRLPRKAPDWALPQPCSGSWDSSLLFLEPPALMEGSGT